MLRSWENLGSHNSFAVKPNLFFSYNLSPCKDLLAFRWNVWSSSSGSSSPAIYHLTRFNTPENSSSSATCSFMNCNNDRHIGGINEPRLIRNDVSFNFYDLNRSGPRFCVADDCTILGDFYKKKENKITNKKLGTKFNIYLERKYKSQ
jgi:hypothetical protein